MTTKKRKMKHGDAATGRGQCTNRGARRTRTEENEEEPVDLPKEIPEEWMVHQTVEVSLPSNHPSTRSTTAGSWNLANAAGAAAAAPAPPSNATSVMPMPAPTAWSAAPVVELSGEELTAWVARLYGRRP